MMPMQNKQRYNFLFDIVQHLQRSQILKYLQLYLEIFYTQVYLWQFQHKSNRSKKILEELAKQSRMSFIFKWWFHPYILLVGYPSLCNKPKWKLWQTVHFGAQKKLTQQTVASNGSFSYNPNTLLFHSCILIFSQTANTLTILSLGAALKGKEIIFVAL